MPNLPWDASSLANPLSRSKVALRNLRRLIDDDVPLIQ